ncbi:MAG: acetyl-CoA synthase subunit gamma, partial [Coriobacteriia bacterium]|nr:acetyl-CoA synthase subunit gamma [Coriobacteriia bacterium]
IRPFGAEDFFAYTVAILIGAVVAPTLLPVIPGRAFAFEGWLLGVIGVAGIAWGYGWFSSPYLLLGIGYMLVLPAYAAFLTMSFTGASTHTSPSGVLKEMRIAVPPIIISTAVGIALLLVKAFTG